MHHLYKSKQEEEVTTCVFNVGVFKIPKNNKRYGFLKKTKSF
jgi:hypothetical protein